MADLDPAPGDPPERLRVEETVVDAAWAKASSSSASGYFCVDPDTTPGHPVIDRT